MAFAILRMKNNMRCEHMVPTVYDQDLSAVSESALHTALISDYYEATKAYGRGQPEKVATATHALMHGSALILSAADIACMDLEHAKQIAVAVDTMTTKPIVDVPEPPKDCTRSRAYRTPPVLKIRILQRQAYCPPWNTMPYSTQSCLARML